MKQIIILLSYILTSFVCNAQITFVVKKITFDKAVEHRVPNDVWISRHETPPYLSLECFMVNKDSDSISLVTEESDEKYREEPEIQFSFFLNKKRYLNTRTSSLVLSYELIKRKRIILQPNDTLYFTIENTFLFVQLYNKIYAVSHGDRQLTFEQLLKIIPTLQVTYLNKYAKKGEVRELKAKILPVDKITLEAEPPSTHQPNIRVEVEQTDENVK